MPARMIPSVLPDTVLSDPKRSAEILVYNVLSRDPLLSDCVIFYSCEWLKTYGGLLRDGEADFVVAHPKIGFLVLEVKGGRVRRSVADGKWTTIDRNDEPAPIENPVHQGMKSKKVILEFLLSQWPGKPPWLNARHGVVLPHSCRPRNPSVLGAAAPAEIFAFLEDMPFLAARVIQMMIWTPEGGKLGSAPFGPIGMELLEDFYGRDFDLSPPMPEVLRDNERLIDNLTATQTRYLDFLSKTNSAVIEGGAGTGKTALAMEQARRAAARGRRALLLCFNRPLSVWLTAQLAGTTVSVATFHEFSGRMCRAAGMDLDAIRKHWDENKFLSEKLPSLIQEVGSLDPPERYDDLIIDEGQDFKEAWLKSLRSFLTDSASMFVFRDTFQNIFRDEDNDTWLEQQPYSLTENVRNTQKIFNGSQLFRNDPSATCLGATGIPITWISTNVSSTLTMLEIEISRLIYGEQVPPGDIAILTGKGLRHSVLQNVHMICDLPLQSADFAAGDALIVDSIMRFKGLDRHVILLCDLDDVSSEIAYVGFTRAKTHLIVVGSNHTLDTLGRLQASNDLAF
jgi:hypothetical protein